MLISSMHDNTEKNLVSTSIRWTFSEWRQIANQLCVNRGGEAMDALLLQTIKARDVFLAQEVLPADRHRKLVSIAQGFDAIRARLNAVTQSSSLIDEDHVFQGSPLKSRKDGAAQQSERNLAGACAGREEALPNEAVAQAERREARPQQQAALQADATGLSALVKGTSARLRMTASDDLAAAQPSKRAVMSEQQARAPAGQVALGPAMCRNHVDASRLIEAARPFIVMVAEEFADALLKVFSAQALTHTVSAAPDRVPFHVSACREGALYLPGDGEEQVNVYPNRTGEEHCFAGERHMESVNVDKRAQEEGDWHDEVDVQPLFDPKLPPSANSDFNSSIGLVGTPGTDFEGLRQRYPQLQLTIVQSDTLSDVRKFGHCQRIIALREAISPSTDDLLHRLLRHRYVRLDGGIGAVEGQFDAWLAAPGSISAPSRRSVPLNETRGNGVRGTKRQNRFLKWIGDTR